MPLSSLRPSTSNAGPSTGSRVTFRRPVAVERHLPFVICSLHVVNCACCDCLHDDACNVFVCTYWISSAGSASFVTAPVAAQRHLRAHLFLHVVLVHMMSDCNVFGCTSLHGFPALGPASVVDGLWLLSGILLCVLGKQMNCTLSLAYCASRDCFLHARAVGCILVVFSGAGLWISGMPVASLSSFYLGVSAWRRLGAGVRCGSYVASVGGTSSWQHSLSGP